jgi:hypothetical protein
MGFFLRAPVVNDRLYHTAKSAVGARTRARAPLPPFPRTIPAGRRSLCSRTTAGGPEPSSDGSAQRQTRPTMEACASVRPCWDPARGSRRIAGSLFSYLPASLIPSRTALWTARHLCQQFCLLLPPLPPSRTDLWAAIDGLQMATDSHKQSHENGPLSTRQLCTSQSCVRSSKLMPTA